MPEINSEPLISVIALNHDQGKFLEETLESVRNQTYKNIELIICDDYSSDDSKIKINRWVDRNNYKTKLIFNEQNLGVVKSSNRAIKEATGYYACFIACDDIMLPDKLTTLVKEFSSLDSSYMAIYTDAQLIDDESKPFSDKSFMEHYRYVITPPTGIIFDELKKGDFIPWPSVLFKNEVFEKLGYFDENLIIEDWDFLLRLSKDYKIHYSPKSLVKYRFHLGNIHSSKRYLLEAKYEEFKTLIKHLDDPYCLRRCKSLLVKTYLRGYYRFEEILFLYKASIGNDLLSRIFSLKQPLRIFKAIDRIVS